MLDGLPHSVRTNVTLRVLRRCPFPSPCVNFFPALASTRNYLVYWIIALVPSSTSESPRWFDLRYEGLMKSPGKQRPRVGGPLQGSVLGEAPAHVPPLPGEAPARGHHPWVCCHPRRRGLLGTLSVSSASCRCRRLVVSYVTLCSVCR